MPFEKTTLGRTGLEVGRLGLSASYKMPAAAVERMFEAGMNYVYWGSLRREAFAEGVRNLARYRERMVLVVQCYAPFGWYLRGSVERALSRLGFEYADVLLLGLWNRPVPTRMLEAVRSLKDRGLVRYLGVSTHNRRLVAGQALRDEIDLFHIRYNAVHPGAETDIFPHLAENNRPGLVAFTATSWGQLMGSRRIPRDERTPTAGDCYRFVLSNPNVDVCMTGLGSMEHTEHALEALRRGPMTDDEMAWMRRVGAAIYGKR